MSVRDSHNILVISDLHLGEHLRVEAGHERARTTDQALGEFLEWHATHRDGDRPWRLIVNGDMIDFVAVRLMPADAGVVRGLSEAEHTYGLSDDRRSALHKMRVVLEQHEPVFRAFARFVGAGNRLDVVIGNHDAAFHWLEVQHLFQHAITALWSTQLVEGAAGRPASEVLSSIEFHPWFWFEEGVAWIEHGHQFDPYCSFEDVVAPDTQEEAIDQNIGSALMHFVGNHYLADMESHWGKGFFGYLHFWFSQGFARGLGIFLAYADMCLHLAQVWRDRLPERIARRKARNRIRLERLAYRARLPLRVLQRLRELHHRPAAADLDAIVRAVMLDRLTLLMSIPMVVLAMLVLRPAPIVAALGAGLVWGPLAALSARPRDPVDPREAMRVVSNRIRQVVRVPIVVFGHSHAPVAEQGEGGWYFNTGSWVGDPGRSFTHLRVIRTPGGPLAHLCQWRDGASREL